MGSGKAEKPSKNPKKKRKPLAPNRAETKSKSKSKREKNRADLIESKSDNVKSQEVQAAPAAEQQLSFFVHQFQSANKIQLSSLELDSMKGNFLDPLFGFRDPIRKLYRRLVSDWCSVVFWINQIRALWSCPKIWAKMLKAWGTIWRQRLAHRGKNRFVKSSS